MKKPTQDFLKSRYDYHHSGFFINKGTRKIVRGGLLKNNYRNLCIILDSKTSYLYHRMIWLWHFGYLPKEIDHINSIRADNRIENLRECVKHQNQANRGPNKIRKGGAVLKGVDQDLRKNGRYRARIVHKGKYYHLGTYPTEQEAHNAYMKKSIELNKEFAKGR